MTATAMNDLAALDDAIADMRLARTTHEQWERWIDTAAACCDDCRRSAQEALSGGVGDANHHREWVAKYDRVLSILLARRGALRSPRRRTGSA